MSEETSLYVPADAAGMVALTREWLAARVVFVAGFVIAIAFVTWWSIAHRPSAADLSGTYADTSTDQSDAPAVQTTKEGFMLCRLAIVNAENYGVVPSTMKFAAGPQKTDVRGRYVCLADDKGGARYSFSVDLMCRDLNNASCGSLVEVKKPDGTSLFKRADAPPNTDAAPAPAAPAAVDATGGADTQPPADAGATPDAGTTPDNSGTPPQ